MASNTAIASLSFKIPTLTLVPFDRQSTLWRFSAHICATNRATLPPSHPLYVYAWALWEEKVSGRSVEIFIGLQSTTIIPLHFSRLDKQPSNLRNCAASLISVRPPFLYNLQQRRICSWKSPDCSNAQGFHCTLCCYGEPCRPGDPRTWGAVRARGISICDTALPSSGTACGLGSLSWVLRPEEEHTRAT